MVVSSLASFMEHYEIEVDDSDSIPEVGEVPFSSPDQTIELHDNGLLEISFSIWGTGHGLAPDGLDDVCTALDALVADGGYLEYVDEDASPSNEEACGIRFLGATPRDKILARVHYGLELTEPWLRSVIGADAMQQIERLALSSVTV
jgi:hypothetical protein